MSHKVNPKILRISGIEDWFSRGFYGKNAPRYLEEDLNIRNFIKDNLPKWIMETIEIERRGTSIKLIIKTSRPALIIGRGGEGVEKIRKEIGKIINLGKKDKEEKREIKIEVVAVKDSWASASLASQWIASQIEKRMPFRRVLKMSLGKIMTSKEVKGARVEVAGRLNGITIARTEWLGEGELPRQKIRAIIDYGTCEAQCTYGKIGVKVWIYKGEKFNN